MQAIIEKQVVDVEVLKERKLFGIFKQSLVKFTRTTHYDDGTKFKRNEVMWVNSKKIL